MSSLPSRKEPAVSKNAASKAATGSGTGAPRAPRDAARPRLLDAGCMLVHLMAYALAEGTGADAGAAGAGAGGAAACADPAGAFSQAVGAAPVSGPAPLPEGVSWELVWRLAKANSVQGLTWHAVRRVPDLPADLRRSWEKAANETLWRRAMFDAERAEVLAALNAEGIACLPLKGVTTAPLYPEPDMRTMADNDILYGSVEPDLPAVPPAPSPSSGAPAPAGFRPRGAGRRERQEGACEAMQVARRVMEARGYEAESVGASHHDAYLKPPLFNFELHRMLVSGTSPLHPYYENPWSHAVQDADNPLLFHFRHEDEYLYHVAHAFKHFDHSGCGVRHLADERVMLAAFGPAVDRAYVDAELAKMGPDVVAFEVRLRGLAETCLGPGGAGLEGPAALRGALTADQADILLFMLSSGAYGTVENRVGIAWEKTARASASGRPSLAAYLRERLFMGREELEANYPVFARHPALRPLAPLVRLAHGLGAHPQNIRAELRALVRKAAGRG